MKTATKRFLSVLLTVFMLFGTVALAIPAMVVTASADALTVSVSIDGGAATNQSLPYDLPSNTNVTINGVTFRFDDNGHGSPSGATINADGTVRLRMKNGDMFWMPNVTVTNSSTIQSVATLTGSNCGGSGSVVYQHSSRHGFGPTWNIRPNSGAWSGESSKANVASFRPTSENTTSTLSILEMDPTQTYGDASTAGLVDVTASSSSVFGASIDANNGAWNETLITTVSYAGGAKAVAQDVKGATLATATYASGSLTGAVGFILTWGKWSSMYEYTLSDLSITNATVHGNSKGVFSTYALFTGMEALPLHQNVTVGDNTMRFDPSASNIQSKWFTKDGAIRVKMFKGDMVITVVDSAEELLSATMDVTHLSVRDSKNDGEFSAGLAYNIAYSGNYYTSCTLAQVSTSARRGIGRVYADGSNGGGYGTAISTSPNGAMVGIAPGDQNTTDFWYDSSKAWMPGRTLRYSMVVGSEVVVSFGNTNGDVHTTARYTVGSGNASAPKGSFGFTGGWLDVYRTFEIISLVEQIAGAETLSALRSATDSRISSIRSSANDNSLIWTGNNVRNYYISSSMGSDSNSGTDSAHPWKTLAKVNTALNNKGSTYKYNIYLKRGDTWRGEFLKTYKTSNVTITTYGSGAKPIITGSPENGANASKWTQVAGYTNIWRYAGSDSWEDVGNIVFNNGESYGRKVVQLYVKNSNGQTITDFTHPTAGAQSVSFTSYTDLKNDLDFYHDKNFSGGWGATGYLYLYSTSNPGNRFSSIEFSVKQNGIEIYKANNVRVDNVCVKYVGRHGIAGQGLNMQNILIQNCEFGWIGGSISDRIKNSVIGTDTVAYDLRYGNAVEIYGGCNNFRVQNNYIYQVYDAGITQQYNCESKTDSNHTANQLNIYYHNNVIENCNYSIEYFISNCPTGNSSYIKNFQITNNIMWNAGRGLCETRGIWERGFSAHVKSQSDSTSCNRFANAENAFVISGNQFIGQRDAVFAICSKMNSSNSNANPVITNNEFYGIYQTNKIGAIANYNSGSNVSIHNIYAPYDTNIQTYMNGAIGASKFSGNTIKFLF
ncbi:MAG: hypothetical protein II955_04995 [Clostridia bacterium]|nr:hypothetical protein [Clostridia bacterium]